jgi:hypothetical protein
VWAHVQLAAAIRSIAPFAGVRPFADSGARLLLVASRTPPARSPPAAAAALERERERARTSCRQATRVNVRREEEVSRADTAGERWIDAPARPHSLLQRRVASRSRSEPRADSTSAAVVAAAAASVSSTARAWETEEEQPAEDTQQPLERDGLTSRCEREPLRPHRLSRLLIALAHPAADDDELSLWFAGRHRQRLASRITADWHLLSRSR